MNGTEMHEALDDVLNQPACLCSACGNVACRPGAGVCVDCCEEAGVHEWLSLPGQRVCSDCGQVGLSTEYQSETCCPEVARTGVCYCESDDQGQGR